MSADHPKRQRESLRHALYSPRLSKAMRYADRQASLFRRKVEDVVLAKFGEIDLYRAALIHSASEVQRLASANRHERRIAAEQDKLTLELGLAFDRDYAKHLDMRDRKLQALGLGDSDPLRDFLNGMAAESPAALPAPPEPASGPSHDPTTPEANGGPSHADPA